MNAQDSWHNIIEDTKALLAFHQDLGVDRYPLSEELKKLLTASPRHASPIRRAETPRRPAAVGMPDKPSAKIAAPEQFEPAAAEESLEDIRARLADCNRCRLHKGRRSLLFGSGPRDARLMIIGEWPSAADDRTGKPFSAAEGDMLDKMLVNVLKLSRTEVYLTSLVKCRTGDKAPTREEIAACQPFLLSQIAVIRPRVICAMGPATAQHLLKTNKPLIRLRGQVHDFNGISLVPTFHPSYLINNPEMKKATLVDLQLILKQLL